MPTRKKLRAAACFAALLALCLTACSEQEGGHKLPDRPAVESGERQFTAPADGDLIAIFDTSLGEVRAVLYPDTATMAVENFVGLARTGYYDGTVIWRSEYGFAVQGGDATGTGTGGSTIWSNNPYPLEADASLKHYAGALCAAFATGGDVTGGNSQFYFVTALPDSVDQTQQDQLAQNGYSEAQIQACAAAGGLPRSPPMRRRADCLTWITPIRCSARCTRVWMWWMPWPAWKPRRMRKITIPGAPPRRTPSPSRA